MGTGEAHTNLPADLEMEHANRAAQLDIEAAKGWCFDSQIAVMYTKLTVSIREHLGEGDPEDCHKSNGSSYIMDELDVPQPTYMATSDPNLSKLSSYLTSSS